jgi:hypothetical protein
MWSGVPGAQEVEMSDNKIDKTKNENGNGTEYVTSQSFDRLSAAFESSARRWELIVYPSLFAFILLAAYGFYLVYSLTQDVHRLAVSVDTNMTKMTASMESINKQVSTLEPMLANMSSMDQSMKSMTWSTNHIRNDMGHMSQNISRPMSFMNSFMPW